MDNILFLAILTGAVGHVSWNILLKKSDDKIKFTRAFTLLGSFMMFPLLFFIEPLPRIAWPFFLTTIFIHVFYKIFLCKVYDYSGLSYGYPIARGLPSLILLALTPILFDENLTLSDQLSVIIISSGILLLVFSEGNFKKINIKGLVYSLLVAAIIVAYSTIDAKGARLSNAFIYLIYYFALDGFIFNLISYFTFKNHQLNFIYFKKNFISIFAAASCSIYSYIPAVYGFTVGKIAVIAIYGIFVLKERGGYLALTSAILILLGCVVIKIFQ